MICVIDYGMGNTGSVLRMLKKVGCEASLVNSPEQLSSASKLILPGVGAFDNAMEKLERLGFREALDKLVIGNGVPILGICLGMQLLFNRSEEGQRSGLKWLDGEVKKFRFEGAQSSLAIPHMGWNEVTSVPGSRLFAKSEALSRFYFVHSYHAIPANSSVTSATAEYGYRFCCSVERSNIYGVQFHPEKSHSHGLRLLQTYASLD